MRWSSAVSTAPRLAEAVREAGTAVRERLGSTPPSLCLAFVSAHHRRAWAELPRLVADAVGAETLIGCSAGGVIGGGHEHETGSALSLTAAVLPGVAVRPFHIVDAIDTGHVAFAATGAQHVVLLPDPLSFDVEETLRRLDESCPGGTVVGGLASGGQEPGCHALFTTDRVHDRGCVGVVLAGDLAVDTIVAQGCRPVGEPMFVTRAERNVVHELDGRAAGAVLQDVYRRAAPAERPLFRRALFLGLAMQEHRQRYGHGDFLVRNLLGIDGRSGALVVAALVREGMVVQFHVRDARTSAHDLESLLAAYHGTPHGALLFSCLGRGRGLYGRPDHDTDAFRARLGDVPLGGFFCNGEIGPVGGRTYLHGYTSVFAMVRPRTAAAGDAQVPAA